MYNIVDLELHAVVNNCYYVQRGKPLLMELVHAESKPEIVRVLLEEFPNLKFRFDKCEGYEEWLVLFVWKYAHIGGIIDHLPEVPRTPFDYWVLGKAFGYSEDSIAEFLANKEIFGAKEEETE